MTTGDGDRASKGSSRSGLPSVEPRESSRIRLGGFFTSYPGSYAAAWRRLMPGSAQLALPTLYLQRHTYELLLKQILLGILTTRRQRQVMDDLLGSLKSAGPVEPEHYELAHTSHELRRLADLVAMNLLALELPELPSAFNQVYLLLNAVEEGRPERFRYAELYSRQSGRTTASFTYGLDDNDAKYAPIDEVGRLLDQILDGQGAAPGTRDGPIGAVRSFFDALIDSEEDAHREVAEELKAIECATRNGELEWRIASEPSLSLARHPAFDHLVAHVDPRYFVCDYRHRRLALVVLGEAASSSEEATRSGYEVFLGSLRPNGTLTDGVFPSSYQSNLQQAVRDAWFTRSREP